jgi:hypothetical protein
MKPGRKTCLPVFPAHRDKHERPARAQGERRRRGRSSFSRLRGERERELRLLRAPPSSPATAAATASGGAGPASTFSSSRTLLARSSLSRSFLHISLRTQRGQRTVLTSACRACPRSAYANGSSSVASPGIAASASSAARGGGWSAQRVLAQERSPAPERTSDSVRQRSAN